jgi:hypothetical protein
LAQLTHQTLAAGGAQLVVAAEALAQGFQPPLILAVQALRGLAEGAAHKATEGVSPPLEIAEAPIRLQPGRPVQGIAPSPQAWRRGAQIPSGGFSWLS